MRLIAAVIVVACIAVGALYAKTQAVASFEHAVATQQARSEA